MLIIDVSQNDLEGKKLEGNSTERTGGDHHNTGSPALYQGKMPF